jgi:hypothetical protein
MRKIRVLDVEFENPINAWETPAFRGAVIATAGKENTLFHNHLGKNYRFGYPLIQYKRIGKKPHLVCIEDGVDEVHHFFENKQEGLMLGDRPYELKVDSIRLNRFTMQVWDKTFQYFMQDWLPLKQDNYKEYKGLTSEIAQLEFLEKILKGNILSFAKGVGWNVEKEVKLRIQDIVRTNIISVKGIKREAFTLNFTTNVFLPNHIGLGRNTSLGFGVIWENKKRNRK